MSYAKPAFLASVVAAGFLCASQFAEAGVGYYYAAPSTYYAAPLYGGNYGGYAGYGYGGPGYGFGYGGAGYGSLGYANYGYRSIGYGGLGYSNYGYQSYRSTGFGLGLGGYGRSYYSPGVTYGANPYLRYNSYVPRYYPGPGYSGYGYSNYGYSPSFNGGSRYDSIYGVTGRHNSIYGW